MGVASLIVGAGLPTVPPLAVLSGIVGAGAGAGLVWAVGGFGTEGAGGATGGAGCPAPATAGGGAIGASAAFSVTLTVSFLSGTLDVCLDGVGFGSGFSESLITVMETHDRFSRSAAFHGIARVVSNPQSGFPSPTRARLRKNDSNQRTTSQHDLAAPPNPKVRPPVTLAPTAGVPPDEFNPLP